MVTGTAQEKVCHDQATTIRRGVHIRGNDEKKKCPSTKGGGKQSKRKAPWKIQKKWWVSGNFVGKKGKPASLEKKGQGRWEKIITGKPVDR